MTFVLRIRSLNLRTFWHENYYFPNKKNGKCVLSSITVSNIAVLPGEKIIKREIAVLEEEFSLMQQTSLLYKDVEQEQ